MNSKHDWDEEEHDSLKAFGGQLEIIRRRQAADPPIELLLAAPAESLLEQPFDQVTERRVWTSIQGRVQHADSPPSFGTSSRWVAGAAIAASIAVAVVVSRNQGEMTAPVTRAAPAPASPAPPARVVLQFTKPEVKLSAAALTWRGDDAANSYLRDLKPAIDAYRSGSYADAERHFVALAQRYPLVVEIPFFLGVVRMLRDDFAGAAAPLAAALAMNEPTFREDATWYLAVTEQRSGREGDAIRKIATLCDGGGARAPEACAAQKLFSVPR